MKVVTKQLHRIADVCIDLYLFLISKLRCDSDEENLPEKETLRGNSPDFFSYTIIIMKCFILVLDSELIPGTLV